MFAEKRAQQSSAVRKLLEMSDSKKQRKLIKDLLVNIKKVLMECETLLARESIDLDSMRVLAVGERKASPQGEAELREAVSMVVENAAFVCQFVLYFPEMVGRMFRKDDDLMRTFKWAYEMSLKLSLHDPGTEELMDLAGQELQLIPRRDDYTNPYSQASRREEMERAAVEESKRRNDKKPREPVLSRPSLDEL